MVAKKPRNRRGAGPARSGAAGRPAPATAGSAPASQAPAGAPASTAQLTARPAAGQTYYPGQGFGLPEHGPGSVASMPRRVLALLID